MNLRISTPSADVHPLRQQYLTLKSKEIVASKGREYETHIREHKHSSANRAEGQVRDKEHFGQCASGFANTGRSILIWGVSAERDGDGVDRVIDTPGVKDAEQLAMAIA